MRATSTTTMPRASGRCASSRAKPARRSAYSGASSGNRAPSAVEAHDLWCAGEGAEHDDDAAILLQVGHGLRAATNQVDVGDRLRIENAEDPGATLRRDIDMPAGVVRRGGHEEHRLLVQPRLDRGVNRVVGASHRGVLSWRAAHSSWARSAHAALCETGRVIIAGGWACTARDLVILPRPGAIGRLPVVAYAQSRISATPTLPVIRCRPHVAPA